MNNRKVPDWAPVDCMEDPWYLNDHYGQSGIMSIYEGGHYFTPEVWDFVSYQFERFRLPIPREDLVIWCWEWAFYYVDQYDPYMFFFGLSDVCKTDDNYYYQYAVQDHQGIWRECEADSLEHYATWEGYLPRFKEMMDSPGLAEYIPMAEEVLQDHLSNCHEEPDGFSQEQKFFRRYGPKAYDFIHLGVWSCLMWMLSPEAMWWREKYHPIFKICYDYGEALMHGWTLYDPDEYRVVERPAHSCVKCGSREYCVELTQVEALGFQTGTYFICEHCLHPKTLEGFDCGTRSCSNFKCPYHPNKDNLSLVATEKRYGKLKTTRGVQHRALPGIMMLNHIAIERQASSIADIVGERFKQLISQ